MIRVLNARVKLILTLAFILCISLTPSGAWPAYILFLTTVLSALAASGAGISSVLKRSLFVTPFILAAAPLIFFGPQPYLSLSLGKLGMLPLSLGGVERFLSIAFKSWVSVLAAALFAAATPTPDMLAALHDLGAPGVFTAVIALMWRYLHVLRAEVIRLLRARSSRSSILPGKQARRPGGSLAWRARVTGGMAGSLLLRSLERSERVYSAMLARGYNGNPPFYRPVPPTAFERRVLFFSLALFLFLLILGFLTGG